MPRIDVVNLNKTYRINERFIKKIAAAVLKFIKKPETADIEIVFLDNKAIAAFNKRYKATPGPTDVLSFKIDRSEFGQGPFLGEILISSERAKENAKVFGTDFEEEIALYVIHGILHLFGYDDENPEDRCLMDKKEKEVLRYLCRKEDLSKVLIPR